MSGNFVKGKYSGVYYREHDTRKNGIRKDRYFIIRYIGIDKKRHGEGFGWESEGYTELKAFQTLCEIKDNIKSGKGFMSLKERQELALAEKKAKEIEERNDPTITFGEFFEKHYIESANNATNKKSSYRLYVQKTLGKMTFAEITPLVLEKWKKTWEKKYAAETVNHTLRMISHVFNTAILNGFYNGINPVTRVKKIKKDNKRLRFLEKDEAELLLEKCNSYAVDPGCYAYKFYKEHGITQLWEIAFLSLYTGMRQGEIFNLKVADVDLRKMQITILDPKNSETRIAPMTNKVYDMLKTHIEGIGQNKDEYVFPDKSGNKKGFLNKHWQIAIAETHLNDHISDARQKIVFHTLRHTYASWLAIAGVDLYTIQKLMGHKDIKMTQRYSHLSPDKFKAAVDVLN